MFSVDVPKDGADELQMNGYAGSPKSSAVVNSKKKQGWITKGGKYYYKNSNGKYLKNGVYKIGKYYYFFDNKGVSCTGKKIRNDCVYVMDKATRRCKEQYFRLVVQDVNGKNIVGSLYGKRSVNLFQQSLKGLRIEDQSGNVLRNYKPRQGDFYCDTKSHRAAA